MNQVETNETRADRQRYFVDRHTICLPFAGKEQQPRKNAIDIKMRRFSSIAFIFADDFQTHSEAPSISIYHMSADQSTSFTVSVTTSFHAVLSNTIVEDLLSVSVFTKFSY